MFFITPQPLQRGFGLDLPAVVDTDRHVLVLLDVEVGEFGEIVIGQKAQLSDGSDPIIGRGHGRYRS